MLQIYPCFSPMVSDTSPPWTCRCRLCVFLLFLLSLQTCCSPLIYTAAMPPVITVCYKHPAQSTSPCQVVAIKVSSLGLSHWHTFSVIFALCSLPVYLACLDAYLQVILCFCFFVILCSNFPLIRVKFFQRRHIK